MFGKVILEVSIQISAEKAVVHYSHGKCTEDELNNFKIIAFLLYTVRMIWNSDSDYKPLRLQMRHILDNQSQEGDDRAWPITFASVYTEKRAMELIDSIREPLIIFSGKLIINTDNSFFIKTKLGSLFQYNLGARHAPTSVFVFWQDLMNTLSEEENEKISKGLKAILDYFDGVQNKKWTVGIMNEAINIVNKIEFNN